MNKFTTGLVTGAVIAAGIVLVSNPMSKRDVRRVRNSSRRALRGINRTIHRWT